MKKLFSILMAIIIICCLNLAAFAEDESLPDATESVTEAETEVETDGESETILDNETLPDDGESESFMFFTDMHTGTSLDLMEKSLNKMKAVYDHSPVSFCISGGDWLNNADTKEEACQILGIIDGCCRSRFPLFLPLLGNHDTNYQGSPDRETAQLSQQTIDNLLFRQEGKSYYKKKVPNSMVYAFNTETDWESSTLNDFKKEQLKWFGENLKTDDSSHSFVTMHIALESHRVVPFIDDITKLIQAYNARTTITIEGETHDYTGCTGTCHFVIAGHDHADYNTTLNSVPIILTESVLESSNDTPTTNSGHEDAFDLCLADYTNHKLHCVRCGYGENRTIDII